MDTGSESCATVLHGNRSQAGDRDCSRARVGATGCNPEELLPNGIGCDGRRRGDGDRVRASARSTAPRKGLSLGLSKRQTVCRSGAYRQARELFAVHGKVGCDGGLTIDSNGLRQRGPDSGVVRIRLVATDDRSVDEVRIRVRIDSGAVASHSKCPFF